VCPQTLQAKPQGTQAGAPAAAADTAYLPEERWHRKDLNPNRDQPYGSRDQQYGSRDQQYGGRDQQYGSRDQQYGSRSGPKTKPYPSAGSGSEPYPAEPYPSYGSGPNGGGGGGSGGQLKPPEFVQEDCIKNIDEFAEAFNRGGVNRCAGVVAAAARCWQLTPSKSVSCVAVCHKGDAMKGQRPSTGQVS
jgi:hypothetical protein